MKKLAHTGEMCNFFIHNLQRHQQRIYICFVYRVLLFCPPIHPTHDHANDAFSSRRQREHKKEWRKSKHTHVRFGIIHSFSSIDLHIRSAQSSYILTCRIAEFLHTPVNRSQMNKEKKKRKKEIIQPNYSQFYMLVIKCDNLQQSGGNCSHSKAKLPRE